MGDRCPASRGVKGMCYINIHFCHFISDYLSKKQLFLKEAEVAKLHNKKLENTGGVCYATLTHNWAELWI